jgi:DtxR family transcriptional regulator, Mn-dependent transcriptional regulator
MKPVTGDSAGGLPPGIVALTDLPEETGNIILRRIAEQIQSDTALLTRLRQAGLQPGTPVPVSHANGNLRIGTGQHAAELDHTAAAHIFVSAAGRSTAAGPTASAGHPE